MQRVRPLGSGVRFQVRVTPRSSRDRVEAWQMDGKGQPELKLRVRAVAEDGKANAAVAALLSEALGVPKKNVAIASGQNARTKLIDIAGDAAWLTARLQDLGEGR